MSETDQPSQRITLGLDLNIHHYFHWPDEPLRVMSIPYPRSAAALTMTVTKEPKVGATFTVDTTDGVASLQFDDDHGDPLAGPNDSVTGAPIAPVVSTDNADVLTAAASVAGATPGAWTAALTPVAMGTANVILAPLTNSDGSPALDSAGNPFSEAAPIEVTVNAGPVSGLEMSVTG